MEPILFDGLTPQKYIWVSPTGSDLGTGSETSPLKTIQAAVNKATAGTAIMVTAGVYYENVKLPTNALGTADNPIWLMSADGPQAAKIVGVSQTVATIYGYGTDNYVVSGFEIEGGFRGIQFSQSGRDFTNMVSNIVVEGNYIHDTLEDGIKIGQANNAYVVGNTVTNVVEEGIDFLAVNNGFILYNEVSYANSTAAGIFAKGGSTGVLIEGNYVHDILYGDGICIGGQTETAYFRPGYTTYEAKDVLVTGNYVEDVARRPVNVKGALDSQIIDNYLVGNPTYYAAIAIQGGWASATPLMYSANIEVANNILVGNQKVVIHDGSNNNISIHDNTSTGQWTTTVGPDAYFVTTEPPPPTNDAPVIVSATATGQATEWADNSAGETANTPHTASGSVVYADANASDLHTASFAPKGTGYLGTFSLNTAAIDSSDTVGWSFSVSDSAIDYLTAGQTKTQLYDVTINDGHGGTITKTITITLTGAGDATPNSAPVIVSTTATGQATEWADNSAGETANTPHTASGSVVYADANALDLHTAHFSPKGTGYLGTFSLNTATIDSSDTVGWSFSVSDSAIDYLTAGQTKTQLYDVTVDDGHGGTVTQTVTITLTGAGDVAVTSANSAPVIVSATATAQVTEWADKSANESANASHTASGAVVYSDANALDTHTASFTPNGTGYLGTFSLDTAAIDSADTLNWLFTVSDSAMDYLKAGKTKVQSYDVTINDGHGGTDVQTITVTLVGTGDSGSSSTPRTTRVRSNDPNSAQDYGTSSDSSEPGRFHDHHAASDLTTVLGTHESLGDYVYG